MGETGKHTYNRDWIIREISKRCFVTQKDVTIILSVFEDLIREIVVEKESFIWQNILTFRIFKKPSTRMYNWDQKKIIHTKYNYKIRMKPSLKLREICNQEEKKPEDPLE